MSAPTTLPQFTHEGIQYPEYPSDRVQWHSWSIADAAKQVGTDDSMVRILRIAPDAEGPLRRYTSVVKGVLRAVAEHTGAAVVPYTLGLASIPHGELSPPELRVAQHTMLPKGYALVGRVTLVQGASPIQHGSAAGQQIITGIQRYRRELDPRQLRWLDLRNEAEDPETALLSQFVEGRVRDIVGQFLVDIDHYVA